MAATKFSRRNIHFLKLKCHETKLKIGVERLFIDNAIKIRNKKEICVTLIDFPPVIKRDPQFLIMWKSLLWIRREREREIHNSHLQHILLQMPKHSFPLAVPCTYNFGYHSTDDRFKGNEMRASLAALCAP